MSAEIQALINRCNASLAQFDSKTNAINSQLNNIRAIAKSSIFSQAKTRGY